MTSESLQKHAGILLERIAKKPFVANELINTYIASHKHFDGDDKRALLDVVWRCVRAMARLKFAYPNDTWEVRVKRLMGEGVPKVKNAPDWVKWEVPEWFLDHVPEAEKELPALLENPPIILRATSTASSPA